MQHSVVSRIIHNNIVSHLAYTHVHLVYDHHAFLLKAPTLNEEEKKRKEEEGRWHRQNRHHHSLLAPLFSCDSYPRTVTLSLQQPTTVSTPFCIPLSSERYSSIMFTS